MASSSITATQNLLPSSSSLLDHQIWQDLLANPELGSQLDHDLGRRLIDKLATFRLQHTTRPIGNNLAQRGRIILRLHNDLPSFVALATANRWIQYPATKRRLVGLIYVDAILAILGFVEETTDAAIVFRGMHRHVLVAGDIISVGSRDEFHAIVELRAQDVVGAAGSVGR